MFFFSYYILVMSYWWTIVSNLDKSWVSNEFGYEPYNEWEKKWRTLIWEFSEWGEIKSLGRGSKISEEDPSLWIRDSKIWIHGSKLNLETWEKTHYFIILKSEYKVFHKGLYTMGRNTKNSNITKGPIKPKQKHYKNYKIVPILWSETNPRSLRRSWASFHQLL